MHVIIKSRNFAIFLNTNTVCCQTSSMTVRTEHVRAHRQMRTGSGIFNFKNDGVGRRRRGIVGAGRVGSLLEFRWDKAFTERTLQSNCLDLSNFDSVYCVGLQISSYLVTGEQGYRTGFRDQTGKDTIKSAYFAFYLSINNRRNYCNDVIFINV